MKRIAVIGGGAAGLAAAITAAESGSEVTVYEKNDRVGRKLLSTGNGRCNLSNVDRDLTHFHGDKGFISEILGKADVDSFISSCGIVTRVENGRIYPYSNHASSVLDALRFRAEELGVKFVTDCTILSAGRRMGRFSFQNESKAGFSSDKLIITAGGKAAPALGADGGGYKLLSSFGHNITALYPSLVQLKCKREQMKGLKGIRAFANAKLLCDGKLIKEEYGEIQFADYGLSGIPIFNLSTEIGALSGEITVSLDLLPQLDNVMPHLRGRNPKHLFTGIFHSRLAEAVYARAKKPSLDALAAVIKDFRFDFLGLNGWENAQVTSGGAVTDEFNFNLESKLVPELFAAGEVLNVDGDCGGYNLHWAWASGIIAGRSAADD